MEDKRACNEKVVACCG